MVNNRNYTIDVFRLLGAFCVVFLHSNLGDLPNFYVIVSKLSCKWAVPFFFLISGYFFEINFKAKGSEYIIKTLNNFLAIFLVANFIFALYSSLYSPETLHNAFNFNAFGIGLNGHLWFISSMILGYLLLVLFIYKKLEKQLIFLAIFLYLMVLVSHGYSNFFHIRINRDFTRHFVSIPFLVIGYYISRYTLAERYFSVRLGVTLVIVGWVLQLVEALGIYYLSSFSPHGHEFLIGTLLFSVGVFILSFELTLNQDNLFSRLGRIYSLQIYLYHPLLLGLFAMITTKFKTGTIASTFYLLSPILIFALVLLLLMIIHKISLRLFKFISGI